ncbi:MAG: formylglycine-generating enzyme family protein [Planctomycetaceae bacterium]
MPIRFLTVFIASSIVWQTMTLSADKQPNVKTNPLLKVFVSEFVAIKPGHGRFPRSFSMGASTGPAEEMPARTVSFDYGFEIAKYEVPQNLYQAVMGDNPSRWKGPRNSVEMMSWAQANAFCQRITTLLMDAKLIDADQKIRLPTEAEWEYCCRAGTTTAYSFGDKARKEGDQGKKASLLDDFAWHTGNAAGNDPPVGAKKPNPWGLYDMHGYLWEFVQDDWKSGYRGAPQDGSAVKSDSKQRIARGGSWKDDFRRLTSTARRAINHSDPAAKSDRGDEVGFRCVLVRTSSKSTR